MKKVFQKIKRKIIDKASDVLSYPARMEGKRVEKEATEDFHALRTAREYGKDTIVEPGSSLDQLLWRAKNAKERYKRK